MSKIYQKTYPAGKNAGFTLIELLVVVLIIGILAAVALPQYTKAVAKARTAEALTMLKSIIDAQEVYFMATGEYTNDIEDLDISISSDLLGSWGAGKSTDPNQYFYSCYSLRTCGAFAANKDLPNIEFHFANKTFQGSSEYKGKKWCQVLQGNKSETALNICKSMGQLDTTVTDYPGKFYRLN